MAHALLSASGAHRWLNCPGSVTLERDLPDTSTEYAREGTLAHAIAELKLKKYFFNDLDTKEYKTTLKELEENSLYQNEMKGYTDIYIDAIKNKALSFNDKPYINIEEQVDFSEYVPEGFGTADCVMIFGKELIIADLKYGKGVVVDAENNPQLMLYALGAYCKYSMLYNIEKITMTIIQPRLDNIKSWAIETAELLKFGERIKPIAQEAYHGSAKFKTGEHCKFCKAKAICKERARTMFNSVEDIKAAGDTATLSNDDIALYLVKSKGVTDWIKDLEDLALKAILRGEKIRGFKVVEGRSNRAFKDTDKAFKTLINYGIDEKSLYERVPLTLAKVEKLVGKKDFNELLNNYVENPKGKPTLVAESDKRAEYVINDATAMFKKIN